ncbi:trypsin Tyr p 3.0101-like [Plutella xylostella]|uniref:trypsin Tyr p 3.0101-like n=1 Tax=Plutella xylostella TaxID=51655 RepID=UPI0020327E74|nr:trypsin Tyr p 3.0101-like [Plutella xylostella]
MNVCEKVCVCPHTLGIFQTRQVVIPILVNNNSLSPTGAGTCKGDSGGPLVYNGVVVGVTSFAMRCADSFYPHVFTRVSSYTNWINNTLRQNQVEVVHKLSHNTAVAADVSSLMLLAFVTSIWIMNSEIIYF